MGLGGIGIWQLLIILAIVVMLFGTKRLRAFGSDLGSAIRGFRESLRDGGSNDAQNADATNSVAPTSIDTKSRHGHAA